MTLLIGFLFSDVGPKSDENSSGPGVPPLGPLFYLLLLSNSNRHLPRRSPQFLVVPPKTRIVHDSQTVRQFAKSIRGKAINRMLVAKYTNQAKRLENQREKTRRKSHVV